MMNKIKRKEMLYIKQNGECYIDKDCKWNKIEQKAVRKDGDVTMCDLLNKEIGELTKQKEIEEMVRDLKNCLPSDWFWLKTVDSDAHLVAKHFYNLGYRKIDEDKVVLSREELNTLIGNIEKSSEIKAEELKQARQETAREIIEYLRDNGRKYEVWYLISELAKQCGVEV